MPQLPPPVVVPKKKRNVEDFLGTQLFLKAGVAILVIGVVFAMGLVFQKLGPAGKLAMGYLGGLAMLAGGLFAERRPAYQTFGRAIIAGAWGILYFVTYAGGFIEASKVFTREPVAIAALLVAASAAVAFSLRYRNEWTTTSAFLLIFLGLGMAAWDLEPTFNLTSTAIVALAMAVLVWRTGWVRLLGLGLPATWATLTFWILRRPHLAGDPALLVTLVLCWAAFQLALLFFKSEEEREAWVGLSQIGNFLGGFGLCLHQTLHLGHPWVWAALFGVANLGVAWAYHRRGRRAMYLLAATEGLAALALVTPLRLGWKSHLVPVYRLVGIETLLAGGVFLKEKYFRRIAYAAFGITLLEILAVKLGQGPGVGRTLLLGLASGVWLVDAILLRTVWREACDDRGETDDSSMHEIPWAPYLFGAAGTLVLGLLVWLEVPLKAQATVYAALALLWLGAGWAMGLKDILIASPVLGTASLACTAWALVVIPGAPGQIPVRWMGPAASAVLLVLGAALTRRKPHRGIPETWAPVFMRIFGALALLSVWGLLIRETTDSWRAISFGLLALVLMATGAAFRLKTLPMGSLFTLTAALAALVLRPAPMTPWAWRLTAQGWSLAVVAASAFGMEALVRGWTDRIALGPDGTKLARWLTGISGLVLVNELVWTETPSQWTAVTLGAVAVAHLAIGLAVRAKDRIAGALVLLALSWLALVVQPVPDAPPIAHLSLRGWSIAGLAAASFGMEFLLRRDRAKALIESQRDWHASVLATGFSGFILGLVAIGLEVPEVWVTPALGGASVLYLGLAILWSHKDRVAGSLALLVIALVSLWLRPATTWVVWAHLTLRGWNLLAVAVAAFLLETLVRIPASRRVLAGRERDGALWFVSLTGMALSLMVIWSEAPVAWIAPLMTALATVLLLLGLLLGFREQIFGSMVTGAAGLVAMGMLGGRYNGDWLHVSTRAWNLGLLAGLSLAQELILRIWRKGWKWSESALQWLAGSHSVKATGLLVLLAFLEFKRVWIPGSLMAFAFAWLLWARKRPSVLHALEAFGFAAAGFAAMAFMIGMAQAGPERLWFGVPERILSIGLGVAVAYLFQREVQVASEEQVADRILLNDHMLLGRAGVAVLILTTLTLSAFLWVEAGLRHREELVPLGWGAVALVYFERGRSLRKAHWTLLGHVLMGLGLVHVLLVNLGMDDLFRGQSLRLWSCLPFLALLAYAYLSWGRIHNGVALGRAAVLRDGYLYGAHALIAALMPFELKRPWVLPAWALQGGGSLFHGVWRNRVPWLRTALILALAAFGRGLAENFAHWDAFLVGGENLVAVPLTSAALLAGYIRLRVWNPEAEEEGGAGSPSRALLEGRHRMPWFAMQAILLFLFLWMQADGTSLTVWATAYGFGMVGLGFAFRERVARLVGLGMLSCCTLKLFLWDLRGLQGLSRVASFIVLGVVLITVSFVYTRFKDRLEKLL
jgi:hypothetical protein